MKKRRQRVSLTVEYINESHFIVGWRTENERVFQSLKEYVKNLEGSIYMPMMRKWRVNITDENIRKLKNRGFRFLGEAYFLANKVTFSAKVAEPPKRKVVDKSLLHKDLRNYQVEGVEMLLGLKGCALLSDPCGAGKSAQASSYLKIARPLPAVIVCPAGLKVMWKRELEHWAGLSSYICEGTTPEELPDVDCYIVNYDILKNWLHVLQDVKPMIVVSDECQYLINPESLRSQAVMALVSSAGKFIAISGTPLKNRAREFYVVLSILDPGTFRDYDIFLNRFCDPKAGFFGVEYEGTSHGDELHNLISSYQIRREKHIILPELPPLQRIIVPLRLTNKKKIDILSEGLDEEHLSQKEAEELYSNIFEQKEASVFEWIDIWLDANPGEKIVIATYHIYALKSLMEKYKKIALYIDGSVSGNKRQGIVDTFNEDDTHRILFVQIIAGGVGFSAQRAHNIAIAEIWYVPGDLEQVENRIHRANSEGDHFTAYYLTGGNTIEERIMKRLNEKQEDISVVLDGKKKSFLKKGKK